jgi:hypothetical protein
VRVLRIGLELVADHAEIGIGGQAGLADAHAQVRGVDAAGFAAKGVEELPTYGHRKRGVLRRAACARRIPRTREDIAVQELVTDRTALLRCAVLFVRHLGDGHRPRHGSEPTTNGDACRSSQQFVGVMRSSTPGDGFMLVESEPDG